ncbi:aminoglycoside phosphotransferase family protein [Paractinoplanes lichenicola]|uniref:Phosphotransferase n=1 Tax=Paractinoplanes lichenicola TaxID=2802976 RepID=A0ABS1W3S8_9ACTN|nr:aminoglycoside phosphotransferase family protein [Actinoplanes lichenicola]MBL7261396.1 phosphotransferase [Actinoplanes lichenicola]
MDIEAVIERFDLGRLEADPLKVPGGLSNDLWRVRTTQGDFAIKRMVVNAHHPQFVPNVEAAFRVEQQAWTKGVPMPEPVTKNGRALAGVGADLYRVHRWVDGLPGQATVREAADLLSTIHAAGRPRYEATPATVWDGRRWGPKLNRLAQRVAQAPPQTLVVDSHRDLDRKNTLRDGGGRLLALDWDAAGPISAIHEAVALALDWDTWPTTCAGQPIPAEPWIFGGWVAAQGGWLDYQADHDQGEAAAARAKLEQLADRLDDLLNEDDLLSELARPPARPAS